MAKFTASHSAGDLAKFYLSEVFGHSLLAEGVTPRFIAASFAGRIN